MRSVTSDSLGRLMWGDDLRQLTTNVEEVVTHLVHSVHRHPSQRSLERCRVAVHHGAIPVVGTKPGEDVREEVCRVRELTHDVIGVLLDVAVMFDTFVSPHRVERWPIGTPGRQNPLPLHQQNVT